MLFSPITGLVATAQTHPETFVGDWSSTDCWKNLAGRSDCVEYNLRIRATGPELVAVLEGDGFQTQVRLKAKVRRIQGGIEVVCAEDQGSMPGRFKPGLALFRLVSSEKAIRTIWLGLEPVSPGRDVQFIRAKAAP